MPIYRVAVEHVNTAYSDVGTFNTVYHVNTGDVAGALSAAVDIAVVEVPIYSDTTVINMVRASLPGVRGGGGKRGVGIPGGRAASGAILPPWNVAVCRFKSELTSYSVKKFHRIGLGEGDVVGQLLEASVYGLLSTYCAAIVASTFACMPDGDSFDPPFAQPDPAVLMRQPNHHRLHRPGFKRGWVPV